MNNEHAMDEISTSIASLDRDDDPKLLTIEQCLAFWLEARGINPTYAEDIVALMGALKQSSESV